MPAAAVQPVDGEEFPLNGPPSRLFLPGRMKTSWSADSSDGVGQPLFGRFAVLVR
jgi:hypothetical protein